MGGRHRSCRHRHAVGGRAPARAAPGQAHQLHASRVRREGVGLEGRKRRRDHAPAAPAGLLDGLGERAVHDGPRLLGRGAEGVRAALPRRAAVSRQAAGELGPGAAHRDLRPGGREPRCARPHVDLSLPARGRRDLHLCRARRRWRGRAGGEPRLHRHRHHAARDDAGRRRGGGAPGRRALSLHRGQALRDSGGAKGAPPADPDHHGRVSRPRVRLGRGQDHRCARPERLCGGAASRHPDVPG